MTVGRRARISALGLALLCSGLAHGAESPAANADPAHPAVAPSGIPESRKLGNARAVTTSGAEIYSLDGSRREELLRWIYGGGRLTLVGDAAIPAATLLAGVPTDDTREVSLGAGRLVVARPGDAVAGEALDSATAPASSLLEEVAEATRAALRPQAATRGPIAVRLAAWVVLLALFAGAARSGRRARRDLPVLALAIALFALWPFVERHAPGAGGRLVELNVVLDAGPAPPLVWASAALSSASRGRWRLEPGAGAWNLELRGAAGLSLVSETAAAAGDPAVVIEATRGGSGALAWLARGGVSATPRLTLSAGDGRITGIVRNVSDHHWTGIWLLSPGRAPIRLGELEPRGSSVFTTADPARREPLSWSEPDAAPTRWSAAVLARAARELIEPQLARGHSVLIGWTDSPLRPVRLHGADPRRGALTLLIRVLEET